MNVWLALALSTLVVAATVIGVITLERRAARRIDARSNQIDQ